MACSSESDCCELSDNSAGLVLGHIHVGLGRVDRRLFQIDLNLIRLLVELDDQIALSHAVVIVDENLRHLSGNARGHKRHVTVDEGVVGGGRGA